MHITDADREAADDLRVILADICGFWHKPGDDSPLCLALARHRVEAEQRTATMLSPLIMAVVPQSGFDMGRPHQRPGRPRLAPQRLVERPPD